MHPIVRLVGVAVAATVLQLQACSQDSSQERGPDDGRERSVAAVRRFFELLHRKQVDAWGELWHERASILVYYPARGFPTRIDGKAAIVSGFRSLVASFESFRSELTGIHPTADGAAVSVQYRVRARLTDGTEYTNDNIAVFQFEGGLIRVYHDYFDPRRFQTVVDFLAFTTRKGASAMEQPHAGVNRVSFRSDGETLIGNLHLPADYQAGKRLPAVVVVGSLTSVKEQMSGLYAQRLAERGFAALAFDYRNFGESSGEPRQYESPRQHIADIRNAVGFLMTVPAVDPRRIGGLGVCTGGAYMGVAAADDTRIAAYAGVALHIGSADASRALYGGDDGVRQRREASQRAARRYRDSGQVDYLMAYSNKPGDPTASHAGPMEYYFDSSRGHILPWTNRFAVMSWEEWIDFAPIEAAGRIRMPSLVIHSDDAALPDNARAFFDGIATGDKRLIWRREPHFDFYDGEASKEAAREVAAHFEAALAP